MNETVGFIGLGVMGRPMAKHILAKGYSGRVQPKPWAGRRNRDGRRGSRLRRRPKSSPGDRRHHDGARYARCRAGAAGAERRAERVAAWFGGDRHEQHLARRHAPARGDVAAQGGTMLDAPVSGGEIGAINATLSIMVGGEVRRLKRVRPILECMGNPERIVHIGRSRVPARCARCAIRWRSVERWLA